MYRLQCKPQNYAWGKLGHDSLVAKLLAANPSTISSTPVMDPSKPYAELWMGTHPSAPSMVIMEEREKEDQANSSFSVLPLKQFINSQNLGKDHAATFGSNHNDLPFLFKVLSINKALSIQAHPDKKLAARLHKEDPAHYPDSNHKPELVVALSPFQALCCFRKVKEVVMFLESIPELAEQTGYSGNDEFSKMLKEKASDLIAGEEGNNNKTGNNIATAFFKPLLSKLYSIPKEKNAELQQKFMARMNNNSNKNEQQQQVEQNASFTKTSNRAFAAFKQIYSQFPDDVGCWMVFVLNVVDMQPGDGLFLAANEPHAYLAGDCVEIMAASDNVIRAGLTPKFKDVETLLESLTYRTDSLEAAAFTNNPVCHLQSYVPPSFIPEFRLERVTVFKNNGGENSSRVRIPIDSASIFLTLQAEEGKCKCTCICGTEDDFELPSFDANTNAGSSENDKTKIRHTREGSGIITITKGLQTSDNEHKVTSIKIGDVRAVLLDNIPTTPANTPSVEFKESQQRFLEFENLSTTTDLVCFVAQARGDGNPMATPKLTAARKNDVVSSSTKQ